MMIVSIIPARAESSDTAAAEEDSESESSQSARRSMLFWHQAAGFATWGTWLATNLAGDRAMKSLQSTETFANLILLQNPQAN